MRIWTMFLGLALATACSSGSDDGSGDDDCNNPTSCGVSGCKMAEECNGLSDCGLGSSNFIEPEFCVHCPPRSDTHVCEAGVCRETTLSNIDVMFVVPPEASGARSFTITAFNPIMADGGTLTCTALASSCGFVGNEMLNAGNSRASAFPGGMADPANVYTSRIAADVGTDRVVFVQAVTDTQGKGSVVARGCVEQVEVKAMEIVRVPMDLTAI